MNKRTSCTEKGFTLLELAVVLAALALVSTAAIPYFVRQIEIAAAQKTAKEVSTIQEAAKWYYVNNKVWPVSIGTLQNAGFLNPSWSAINPWGSGYSTSSSGGSFAVTTTIPSNVTGVLTRALPGVSVSGGTVTSIVPVPGQEASLTEVTNLANNALTKANESALPPYGPYEISVVESCAGLPECVVLCPEGWVQTGRYIFEGNKILCRRVSR